MLIISESKTIVYEVKKSKFITTSHYIETLDQVRPIINKTKEEHPSAVHTVHCSIVGENRTEFSYSDDGEPKGTSGRPSFEVLKGSGLTNVLITITRYFGGTLLGTGGLVSAYSTSVKNLLEVQPSKVLVKTSTTCFNIDYSLIKTITKIAEELNALVEFTYDEFVSVKVTINDDLKQSFIDKVVNSTNASVTPYFKS